MASIKRKEAREILFTLLFETEFKSGDSIDEVYGISSENRDIPENAYIKKSFFEINEKADLLDRVISKYAKGWKADRLSKVSRSVIRLAVYEILFCKDIPANVSVSEAVELAKKYGEEKARAFVNGVLSSIVKDVEARIFILLLISRRDEVKCTKIKISNVTQIIAQLYRWLWNNRIYFLTFQIFLIFWNFFQIKT